MNLPFIALFLLAVACRLGAEPACAPETGAISHTDICRVEQGDTARQIVAKFGPPLPSDVRLTFLIYELREDRTKMFLVRFDVKRGQAVKADSVVREIEFVDGETHRCVWPAPPIK